MIFFTARNEFEFQVKKYLYENALGLNFLPQAESYPSYGYDLIVHLADIEPIKRDVGCFGFRDDDSVADILCGFSSNSKIPPIEVSTVNLSVGYSYRLKNGFHRYLLSIAAGFTKIPVSINNFDYSAYILD